MVDLNLKQLQQTKTQEDRVPVRSIVKALLRANWRKDDMFQVPLLLYTILKIDGERDVLNTNMDEELIHKVRE